MHSAAPVKKGIKWNATRFLYDNTKVCKNDAADQVMVPNKALSNVPQPDSMKTMFGTEMPEGVVTGPGGTKDTSIKDDSEYVDVDDPFSALLDNEEYQLAFMETLGVDDLKALAEEGMNDALTEKMRHWLMNLGKEQNAGKDDL